MDAGFVNPLLAATVEILGKVAGIDADVKKPFLKTDSKGKGAVSGIITLKGSLTGTAAISFPDKCILMVVSKMFGEEITEVDNDVKDAVGEITNMISGLATQLYETDGLSVKATLDQVVMGDGHSIPHPPGLPVLGIPMVFEPGEVTVELCFNSEKSGK
jgi:chemotaxis protein CheX